MSQGLSYSCLCSKVSEKDPCLHLAIHFHDICTDTVFFESSVLMPGQTKLSQSFTLTVGGSLPAQVFCVLRPNKGKK